MQPQSGAVQIEEEGRLVTSSQASLTREAFLFGSSLSFCFSHIVRARWSVRSLTGEINRIFTPPRRAFGFFSRGSQTAAELAIRETFVPLLPPRETYAASVSCSHFAAPKQIWIYVDPSAAR